MHKGEGYSHCQDSGYMGRIAIFELIIITEKMRHLISKNITTEKLREVVINEGIKPL